MFFLSRTHQPLEASDSGRRFLPGTACCCAGLFFVGDRLQAAGRCLEKTGCLLGEALPV